jgi:hypothetical protein
MTLGAKSGQVCSAVGLMLCLVNATAVMAQVAPPRAEIGGQFTLAGVSLNDSPSFGASLDVNLSRLLAIHARSLWISEGPTSRTQTGAGVRSTFLRGSQWSLYGVALPSWYRVSNSPIFFDRSHFVLDLGIGIAFPVGDRFAGRIEVDRDIHAYRSTPVPNAISAIEPDLPGYVASRWNLTVAGAYGFGAQVRASSATGHDYHWSAGPEAGVVISSSAIPIGVIGGFVAYSINRYVDLDASFANSWSANLPPTVYEGGHLTQVLVGCKLGVRESRVGVYFKIRGGLTSWGETLTIAAPYARANHFALDLGGVVEFDLRANYFLRIDVGESLFFVSEQVPAYSGAVIPLHGPGLYALPMTAGFGLRF